MWMATHGANAIRISQLINLGVFSIGEFVGYLIRSLVAPAFVWFPDILIGMPDNLIQAIAAVWLVVMSIFVPTVIERAIDGF